MHGGNAREKVHCSISHIHIETLITLGNGIVTILLPIERSLLNTETGGRSAWRQRKWGDGREAGSLWIRHNIRNPITFSVHLTGLHNIGTYASTTWFPGWQINLPAPLTTLDPVKTGGFNFAIAVSHGLILVLDNNPQINIDPLQKKKAKAG